MAVQDLPSSLVNLIGIIVQVEETGVIIFYNFQGNKSRCTLDNRLKHGSRYTASDLLPATESFSFKSSYAELSTSELSSIKFSPTALSSAISSSAFTTLESSSSATKPSTTF
ncbi:unnamed protein product [Penicillium salamii]|nr:unnamed protein product [Penicillium salamii]